MGDGGNVCVLVGVVVLVSVVGRGSVTSVTSVGRKVNVLKLSVTDLAVGALVRVIVVVGSSTIFVISRTQFLQTGFGSAEVISKSADWIEDAGGIAEGKRGD